MKKIFLSACIILGIVILQQTYAISVPVSTDLSPILSNCSQSTCNVEPGFGAVKNIMGGIIKYMTYLVGLCAVLYIVINGVLYSMSGLNDGLKSSAKDRIGKMLIGIVILMLSGVILVALAPWIYKG